MRLDTKMKEALVEEIALIILKADYGETTTPQTSLGIEEEFYTHHIPTAHRILDVLLPLADD